jgi:hypothetical protein
MVHTRKRPKGHAHRQPILSSIVFSGTGLEAHLQHGHPEKHVWIYVDMQEQSWVQFMITCKIWASETAALEQEKWSSYLQSVKGTKDDAFSNANSRFCTELELWFALSKTSKEIKITSMTYQLNYKPILQVPRKYVQMGWVHHG